MKKHGVQPQEIKVDWSNESYHVPKMNVRLNMISYDYIGQMDELWSAPDDGGWGERDALPTGDPIGDIDDSSGIKIEIDENMPANEVALKVGDEIQSRITNLGNECDCGAKHTRNPNLHASWCNITMIKAQKEEDSCLDDIMAILNED